MKEFTVEMFGSFQVFYDGTPIVSKDARNSKVLQLFQYLLCRRGSLVPQEDLIDVLLGGKECGNPVSVLKNLVYRLRKLLEEHGAPRDCILYKKSSYGFSGEIPCSIDAEQFEKTCSKSAILQSGRKNSLHCALKQWTFTRADFCPAHPGNPG